MRLGPRLFATLALISSSSALAEGPEQLDQIEPGRGEWQAEYFATFDKRGEGEQAIEAMFGATDRLALGIEIEGEADEGLEIEGFGVKALYRLTGEESPVALGLQIQLGFNRHADLSEVEARLIAEHENETWWAQGNLMLRSSRDGGGREESLGYGLSLQRSVTGNAWFGIEASGRAAGETDGQGHFGGPSLTFEWEPAPDREIEIGLACLHRIDGAGPRSSGRLFVQVTF